MTTSCNHVSLDILQRMPKGTRPDGKITIAFVIHSMQTGGAERSVARLINALDHTQFSPILICLTHSGPAADWIRSPEVPVFEIHKRDAACDRRALRRLTGLLIENRVDIVHSYNWGTLLESAIARRAAAIKAHVHAERGSVLGRPTMTGLRMWGRGLLAGWVMRHCNAVVTNATSVAKRIEQRCGFPADRVHVIPNGVEVDEAVISSAENARLRGELEIDASAIIIGSVGRLVNVKGFDLAIRSLASLRNAGGDFHLFLVGDGPEKNPLRALATALGISKQVHFAGHQRDVGRWLRLMDIYVNTSHSEGMSQSLVEALAAGCPLVATDVGDSAHVVGHDLQCGRLIPAGDVAALTAAIREVSSFECRSQMGQACVIRHRQRFSSATMAQEYEALYRSLHDAGANEAKLQTARAAK